MHGMKSGFAGGIKIHLWEGKPHARARCCLVCFLCVATQLYATWRNTAGIKLWSVACMETVWPKLIDLSKLFTPVTNDTGKLLKSSLFSSDWGCFFLLFDGCWVVFLAWIVKTKLFCFLFIEHFIFFLVPVCHRKELALISNTVEEHFSSELQQQNFNWNSFAKCYTLRSEPSV